MSSLAHLSSSADELLSARDTSREDAARSNSRPGLRRRGAARRACVPALAPEAAAGAFAALDAAPAAAWLHARWDDAVAEAAADAAHLARLRAALPDVPLLAVPEADHDLHSLSDLARVATALS